MRGPVDDIPKIIADNPNYDGIPNSNFCTQVIPAERFEGGGGQTMLPKQIGYRKGMDAVVVEWNVAPIPIWITDKPGFWII
jgi:hypothetical protein